MLLKKAFTLMVLFLITGLSCNAGRKQWIHVYALNGNIIGIKTALTLYNNNCNNNYINVKSSNDDTPLHCAVRGNQFETIIYLLKNGANYNLKNLDKKTAFEIATDFEIKKFFLEYEKATKKNKLLILESYDETKLDNFVSVIKIYPN